MAQGDISRRRAVLLLALAGLAAGPMANGGSAMAEDLAAGILSPDFATAEEALEQAITRRDAALVARALEQNFLEMKVKAARALLEIGDRAAVPPLLAALQANQAAYTGDSETKELQKELNEAAVAALARLTGLQFGRVDPQSAADLQRVLRDAKAWVEKTGK